MKSNDSNAFSSIITDNYTILARTAFLLILYFPLLITSCTTANTPEDSINEFLAACEEAIKKRSGRDLRLLISDDYSDSSGRIKKDISSIASGYLLRNKSIFTYRHVDSLFRQETDLISAKILVAFAAKPISDPSALPSLNSDIYWFDLTIVREGSKWRLAESSWQQAMLDDFFQ